MDSPQLKTIFSEALVRHDGPARAAYLDEACRGDGELRSQVEALLGDHERIGDFLGTAAGPIGLTAEAVGGGPGDRQAGAIMQAEAPPTAPSASAGPGAESPGMVIGPYKLLQVIGEGGMGTVYMAEQERPVRRKVALKVIKAGMDSRQVVARFEAERQALALMDHVNIARVLDAGATESGLPYFVMELVHGVPITKYCDDNQLTPRQRLELFVPVCQAIQHAHQKGIIHRDIKPSNVLVTLYDGKPVPKVIDFGVAKATEQPLTERTLFTQYGTLVGTLEYMSPEQAEMSALGVDTRSDIYSLGVLLYELLTGSTPLSRKRVKEAAFAEILRLIKEEEPPRPSTRLSDSGEALASISAQRHTEPARLTKLVRGELDWIVMKTLEKDRNRRYETASGFAADVQRYLDDEPVQACPPSAVYRLRKFSRRNKRALALVAVAAVAVLIATTTISWSVRDRQAREREISLETAGRLALTEEGIRQALDRGAKSGADLHAILRKPGGVQQLLNQPARWELFIKTAQGELAQARRLATRAEGRLGAGTSQAMNRLDQQLMSDQADYDLALRLEQIRMDRATWVEGSFDDRKAADEYAKAFSGLGVMEDDPVAVAVRLASSPIKDQLLAALDDWAGGAFRLHEQELTERLLAVARQVAPDPTWGDRLRQFKVWSDREALAKLVAEAPAAGLSPQLLDFVGSRLRTDNPLKASWLRRAQAEHPADFWLNLDLGLALQKTNPVEAAGFDRVALAVRPGNSAAYNNLGNALSAQKKPDEAVAAYRKAIEIDPKHTVAHSNLGVAFGGQRKLDEAIAAYRKAIELDPKFVDAHIGLGITLQGKNELNEAIACCRKAIELNPKRAFSHHGLGYALAAQGKVDEAIACYRRAIELDPEYANAQNNLGNALQNQKKPDEAIACYRRAIELDPRFAPAQNNLGNALKAQGKLDEAVAAYRKAIELDPKYVDAHIGLGSALKAQGKLDEAVVSFRKAIELDPKYARAHSGLGNALLDQGKLDEAISCYRRAIEVNPEFADPHSNLGNVLQRQGKVDEAIAAFRKAIELDPRHAIAYGNLGLALGDQGRLDEAVACGRKAIELDPKFANGHNLLGIALITQGKLDEAMACYRKAIELDPKFADPHSNLGNALQRQGKVDEAITSFRRAIELDPRHANAHNGLGNALGMKSWDLVAHPDPKFRDPQRAVEIGQEGVECAPASVSPWQYLGWVQYRAGNWKASIEALEKSCKLEAGTGDFAQWIVMSMAHEKLANGPELSEKERDRHKTEARRLYDQSLKQIGRRTWGEHPFDRALQAFFAEAAELLGVEAKSK